MKTGKVKLLKSLLRLSPKMVAIYRSLSYSIWRLSKIHFSGDTTFSIWLLYIGSFLKYFWWILNISPKILMIWILICLSPQKYK